MEFKSVHKSYTCARKSLTPTFITTIPGNTRNCSST